MAEQTLTMKSTKTQMLDAYQEVLTALEAQKAQQFDPVAEKEAKDKQGVVEHLGEVDWDLNDVFTQMRKSIYGSLQSMQAGLEAEKMELDTVLQAKEALVAELKELYDIRVEAQSFAALVEAQKIQKEAFDRESAQKQAELKISMLEIKEAIAQDKIDSDAERKKKIEEWTYGFARDCKQEQDKFVDTLEELKKSWVLTKEAEAKALGARQEALTKQENELEDLKNLVESFPEKLDAAAKAAKVTAGQAYAFEVTALKRNAEADMKVATYEVSTLRHHEANLEAKVEALETKLETAYDKIQGVANQALEAQGNSRTTEAVQKAVASERAGKNR